MSKIIYTIAIFWVLTLPSCAPNELPNNVVEEPEYSIEGTLDGQDFTLDIGPDNVFVNSDSETVEGEIPSFTVDINGEECEECLGGLEFVISGGQVFNENLSFFDFIFEGNYEVIDPFIESEANFIQVDAELNDIGEVLIDELPFSGSLLNLEEGLHTIGISSIEAIDPLIGYSYTSDFQVGSQGEVCFQQTEITYENSLMTIQVAEEFQGNEIIIQIGSETLFYDDPLTIDALEFVQVDDFSQLLTISIFFNQENGCMISETFAWFGDGLLSFLVPPVSLTNVSIQEPFDPSTVSLVYTNSDNEVYTSIGLEQDWFEIIDIEVAEGSEDSIFNITFSCIIDLVHSENPADIITIQLENAIIPLVFE